MEGGSVITKNEITPELVDAVERECGMGSPAWDCIEAEEIIAAAFNVLYEKLVNKPIEEHLDDAIASVFITDGGLEAEYIVLCDKQGDNITSKTMDECIESGRQYFRNATAGETP